MSDPVYRVDQVRTLDEQTIASGTSALSLMEQAGLAAYHCLLKHWPQVSAMVVFCGPGNNGGDGYVLARLAAEGGVPSTVVRLSSQKFQAGAAFESRTLALQAGVSEVENLTALPGKHDLVGQTVFVDAMFGAGFRGQLQDRFAEAAQRLSRQSSQVLALDIPSGLDADTGVACHSAVRAGVTITFIGQKLGLLTGDGPACCGKVEFSALSVPDRLRNTIAPPVRTLSRHDVMTLRPRRTASFHKGNAGKTLIIAGDTGMGGAAILAAEGASRSGAGTVNLFTHPDHINAALARCPTVMALGVSQPGTQAGHGKKEKLTHRQQSIHEAANAVVLGPGLGQDGWGEAWLQWLSLQSAKPLVLDADALNIIASRASSGEYFSRLNNAGLIITPHPGEAARLLGCSAKDIQGDRYEAVRRLVRLTGAVVILKGAGSLVGWLDNQQRLQVEVCLAGNPGMASGGMGDVLSGVLGSLLAQGLDAVAASRLGCFLHSAAADRLAESSGKTGLLANDLPPMIRHLLNVDLD